MAPIPAIPFILPPDPPQVPEIRVSKMDGSVEVMPVEEYLRGVVAAEMPSSWPLEALKAQAVAARSYAMAAIANPRHAPDADICAGIHCQAYNRKLINERSDLAVSETAGQVILYDGQIATAYYSASCSGQTLGNEDVWGGAPLPYCRPVDCISDKPKSGHGVGMCQWGAHDMAEAGAGYREILKHYYTGVEISGD